MPNDTAQKDKSQARPRAASFDSGTRIVCHSEEHKDLANRVRALESQLAQLKTDAT